MEPESQLNSNADVIKDSYFDRLIASRDRAVVAKSEFSIFASSVPEHIPIFAYEGPDDRLIYDHWIRRINSDLKYEPYVCKNKFATLQLFDVLERDLTGIGGKVFYFVDHDFDFLQGRVSHPKIFCTDMYSVENYLVSSDLLDDLLKIEFYCNGQAKIRESVVTCFLDIYRKFLYATKDINFRIFISRRLNIRQTRDLPTRINAIATVELQEVTRGSSSATELVVLTREPCEEEIEALRPEFEELEPMERYRGKFALMFFIRWLSLLREDRNSAQPACFPGAPRPEFSISGDFSFDSLASKARYPEALPEFLGQI